MSIPVRLPLALLRGLSGLVLVVTVAACSSDKPDEYVEKPVDELYNEARASMEAENYKKAADEFNEVDRQHPYSEWATHAQLMAAYAQYQALKYDDAIIALSRFIELHPGNSDIAYAYYLRALCYYEQIQDARRDQKVTQQALDGLNDVMRRFPDTSYARDAKIKVDLTLDHLAGKEMDIGRYYESQQLYNSAAGRFRQVIDKYQTTNQVPEALHRLTECYLAMGLDDEAKANAAVLGYNYPGSPWYQKSFSLLVSHHLESGDDNSSWLGNALDSVF